MKSLNISGIGWNKAVKKEKLSTPAPSAIDDDKIIDLIQNCHKCDNIKEKKIGIGSGKNGIMIILSAPKMISEMEKKLFKQDSADLLKKIIKSINVDFESCYITNLIKCETDDALSKPSVMFRNCSEITKRELSLFKPGIVLVMGDIIPLRKIINESADIVWFNVDHPFMLLKNPELKKLSWETLKLMMKKMKQLGIQ